MNGVQNGAGMQGKKLHCPNCKSHNFSITTESSITGAISTSSRRGRLGATKFENDHKNFWVCADCGTKFRNIQNLGEEIEKNVKNVRSSIILCIIGAIIDAFLIFSALSGGFLGFLYIPFIFGASIWTIVSFAFIFVYKNRNVKLETEKKWLIENCFN